MNVTADWKAALLSADDNVAVALAPIAAGEYVVVRAPDGMREVLAIEAIPLCHKIAVLDLSIGEDVRKYGHCIGEVREPIALGHKVALSAIETGAPVRKYGQIIGFAALSANETGAPVRKYGQIIGFAARPIAAGAWVHVHNVKADLFERDYAHASVPAPAPPTNATGRRM